LFILLCFAGIIKFKDPAAFSSRDLVNFPALKAKLDQPNDPVSQFLVQEMKRQSLSNTNQTNLADLSAEMSTVLQINAVLNTNTLYDAQRFAAVKLPDGLKEQIEGLKADTDHHELAMANRQLIEAAYPEFISSRGINLLTVANGTALA